jgi:hypothetical protein
METTSSILTQKEITYKVDSDTIMTEKQVMSRSYKGTDHEFISTQKEITNEKTNHESISIEKVKQLKGNRS